MTPHIHAKEIHAFADGYEIEHLSKQYGWDVERYPTFYPDEKYRIKPKANIVRFARVYISDDSSGEYLAFEGYGVQPYLKSLSNVRLTFDGETGELISAEKL